MYNKSNKIYKISILGPQGSGKGTQAEMLSEKLGIPAISMGQLLRDDAEKGTNRGKELEKYLNSGALVPNHFSNEILKERLQQNDIKNGYILDGFPRIRIQAKFLNTLDKLTHVIVVWISNKESLERLAGRRICPCGEIYHLKYKPPKQDELCDKCGKKLEVRDDDKPKAIKERLEIFHNETEPVIEYYRKQGILHEVDGEQRIEEVHKDVLRIFDF